jgi:hypothetical protein
MDRLNETPKWGCVRIVRHSIDGSFDYGVVLGGA